MKNIVETVVVSSLQMQQIEEQIFQAGMPVAALMEKAASLCSDRFQDLYPLATTSSVGVLVGPGHNGADALVIARELYLAGYKVQIFRPFFKLKTLTTQHSNYAVSLGIPLVEEIQALKSCQVIIDGLFGFGLTKDLPENIVEVVNLVNDWGKPIVSIDLPSGIHTDTGAALGTAIRATHTFCLGLWKRAFVQDRALEYLGNSQRLDLGIRPQHIGSVLPEFSVRQMTDQIAKSYLPLPRPAVTHKYHQGNLLLICGSRQYAGAAILTALGARASGVGMLSVAVPESLKTLLVSHLPEALIVDCPENKEGAISSLPFSVTGLNKFQTIACGPGLSADATSVVKKVLQSETPLVLDADGLNILAQDTGVLVLTQRDAPTVLTPHAGEFKRLFPEIDSDGDRLETVAQAAQQSHATILLKGAKTIIANPQGLTWVIADSTPALARGGSGDVLTGLVGGLLAQSEVKANNLYHTVATGAWWHAQAGITAAGERSQLGVDAATLSQYLNQAIAKYCS